MLFVVAKSVVKQGMVEEYKKLTVKLIEETRKEPGNISYDLCQDVDNPNVLTFIEKWQDKEVFAAHMQTAHFKEIVPALRELRESSEINVYQEA